MDPRLVEPYTNADDAEVSLAVSQPGAEAGSAANCAPVEGAWVDRLLRPGDRDLDALAYARFLDGGVPFNLGPGDQAMASAALSYVHRSHPGREVLVLAVPRGLHDAALCVATALQAIHLDTMASPLAAAFSPWRGSIIVVGHNTGVQARLGAIELAGTRLRGGIANALRTYRIRNDGRLSAPDGTVVAHEGGPGRLLYLNTRAQWPELRAERDPVMVIDATRLGQPANVGRALRWADEHEARHVIVVAHLGDGAPLNELRLAERTPLMFELSHHTRHDLVHALNAGHGEGLLSTNATLRLPQPSVRVRSIQHEVADELLGGLVALSSAPGSFETWPMGVQRAHRVLSGLRRLVDDLSAYNQATAIDPWLTSIGSAMWSIEREAELRARNNRWRTFSVAQWGTVRAAALAAYKAIEKTNPKVEPLLDEIDRALRDRDRHVVVRVVDRAAEASLPTKLANHFSAEECKRIAVARVRAQLEWLTDGHPPTTEILPGTPPVHDATWLFTGESTDRVVLAYPFEARWLTRTGEQQVRQIQQARTAFYVRFSLGTPAPLLADVAAAVPAPSRREAASITVGDLWSKLLNLDTPPPATFDDTERIIRRPSRSTSVLLRVETDDHRIHLIAADDEVEVFVAGKYRVRLARELREDDLLLYTTGSGRESIFTRLVTQAHRDLGIDDLDMVLRRFRDACRKVGDGNWAEGNRKLQAAGASATTQLKQWATGETIAPEESTDVRIVADLAGDGQLAENWFRLEALADEIRNLHRKLGHRLSKAIAEALEGGGPNLQKVTEAVGADAAEILDEFKAAKVIKVEAA